MASGLDDLLAGLSVFKQGVTQYAVGQGIQNAQDQISQINSSQQSEIQKRQALTDTANNLTLHLAGLGADANTIQQTAAAIKPVSIATPQEAYNQAVAKGSPELMKLAQQGQAFAMQPEVKMQATKLANENYLKKLEFQKDITVAQIAADPRYQAKPLSDSMVKDITAVETSSQSLRDLATKIEANPDLVGPGAGLNPLRMIGAAGDKSVFDGELAQATLAIAQQAKVMRLNPIQMKMLTTELPTINTPPEIAKQKLNQAADQLDKYKAQYLNTAAAAGKNVQALGGPASPVQKHFQPGAQPGDLYSQSIMKPGEVIRTVPNTKTGKMERVVYAPDESGRFVPVRSAQ